MAVPPGNDERLVAVLEEARALGFLGPGPVGEHIAHAHAFLRGCDDAAEGRGLDLGSGGGVPGLVLALARPARAWVLLDVNARRTAFLATAIDQLGLRDRVEVITARAEEAGRAPQHRGRYQVVVARSFARPAVVGECAAPLLAVGASLLVSEPPEGDDRWPVDGIGALGLASVTTSAGAPRITTLRQQRACPARFPRRVGVPAKRPLW